MVRRAAAGLWSLDGEGAQQLLVIATSSDLQVPNIRSIIAGERDLSASTTTITST
jgi:hypothetical protein